MPFQCLALTKTTATTGTEHGWNVGRVVDVFHELQRKDVTGPRIISVETTDKKDETYELFSKDYVRDKHLNERFRFPDYLFTRSWYKSNGFAGSRRYLDADVVWFRILAKEVQGMMDYNWHEMTILIHQPKGGFVTVICCDMPHESMSNYSSAEKPPSNFLAELRDELDSLQEDFMPDWRFMQAAILRRAIAILDRAIWTNSKAVRVLEKVRPEKGRKSTIFDFPRAHDLLRHSLHNAEVTKVAVDTLNQWISQYYAGERRMLKQEIRQAQHSQNHSPPTSPNHQALPPIQIPQSPTLSQISDLKTSNNQQELAYFDFRDDDLPLLPESCYESLQSSLQLLTALSHRASSNEARLRNEISLAFNLVSQGDTAAMYLISLITLLFLPATFVSTLFSMSFFNYQTPGETKTQWGVSAKIWIYFAVAGPLTIVALIGWIWGRDLLNFFIRRWKKAFSEKKAEESVERANGHVNGSAPNGGTR